MADPTFMPATVFAKRKKEVWDTPDFNPHAVVKPTSTQIYNREAKKTLESLKSVFEADPENISRGSILPFTKDKNTGEVSLGLPGFIKDPLVGLGTYDKILKGEVDPNSPEALKAALDASLGVGLGGLSVSSRSSPNELGMFMGSKSLTFDKEAEALALEMKKAGSSADDVWRATQTRRWKTGSRQELDDSLADIDVNGTFDLVFNRGRGTTLDKVLKYPKLYESYPELKGINIQISPSYKGGEASITRDGTLILVSKEDLDNKDYLLDSILHEVQHRIQQIEGWQPGGNPASFSDKVIQTPNNKLYNLSPLAQYFALPGEVEARVVEARRKLTAQQRAERIPDLDMDRELWQMRLAHPNLIKNSKPWADSFSKSVPQFNRHVDLINTLEKFVAEKRRTNPNKMLESMYFKGKQPDTDRGVARYLDMYMDELPEELKNQLAMQNVRDLETGETLNAMMDGIRGGHIGQLRRLREEYQSGFYD